MVNVSSSIQDDIKKRSRLGSAIGLLCIPSALVGAFVIPRASGGYGGGPCLPTFFFGILPVAFWAFCAALVTAMLIDWSDVVPEQAMGVGKRIGLTTGMRAALVGAGVTWVILAGSALLLAPTGNAFSRSMGMPDKGIMLVIYSLALAIAFAFGVAVGILGGVFGAAIKKH